MSGHRKKAMLALAAASLAATLAPNAVAAAEPSWNGQYLVTLSANAKTGTSMAANRPEYPHKANYTFSSRCASDVCIATVVDAPPPKNEFIPRPIEYTWNGTQWVREISWQWDCLLPDGTIEYAPAKSITAYTPGQYGILTGVFHTDIASGTCKGNVSVGQTDRWLTLPALPSMGGTSRKRMDDQHSPECGDNGVAGKDCHPTDAGGRPGPEKRSRRDKQQLPEQRRERYPDHNSDRGRCAQRARQRHGYCGEVHERGRVDRR